MHALVVEVETADELARLATEARLDAGHPLWGVVADLGPGFVQAHRDHFGQTPFQACRVHFDRRLDAAIPKSRWSAKAPLYAELKARVRAILYAPSYDEARGLLNALIEERARFKGIGKYDTIRTLERNVDVYAAHHHTLGLPADNNVTENVIKQLNNKLRLIEGFESLESAERYVRLPVGCYRFKRFTDSCRRADNGKAPLELAGVDLAGRDWLSYLLDNSDRQSLKLERAAMVRSQPWISGRGASLRAPVMSLIGPPRALNLTLTFFLRLRENVG